jgi:hypothetical protein
MIIATPSVICPRAIARFSNDSVASQAELYTWLSGINFALMHNGSTSRYIDRLCTKLFDLTPESFADYATEEARDEHL